MVCYCGIVELPHSTNSHRHIFVSNKIPLSNKNIVHVFARNIDDRSENKY